MKERCKKHSSSSTRTGGPGSKVHMPCPACGNLLRCMPFQLDLFHFVIGFVAFHCSLTVNGSPCPKPPPTPPCRNPTNVVKRSSHASRTIGHPQRLLSEQTVVAFDASSAVSPRRCTTVASQYCKRLRIAPVGWRAIFVSRRVAQTKLLVRNVRWRRVTAG